MIAALLLLFQSPPGGGAGIQTLIDLAPPGGIVYVTGGGDKFRVNKPLTLMGDGHGSVFNSMELDGTGGSLTVRDLQFLQTIKGGGFDEIRLFECSTAQLDVDGVGYIELNDSVVDGGPLFAPGSDVLATDSNVYPDPFVLPLVTCANLYLSGTAQEGLYDTLSTTVLPVDLTTTSSTVRIGQSFSLSWQMPRPYAYLYASVGSHAPTPSFGTGFLHLTEPARLLAVFGSPGGCPIPIPFNPALIGTEVAFQIRDEPFHYSRPVFVLIH